MGEIQKSVGQMILDHAGLFVIIVLFLLSSFFKLVKRDIDPLGAVIGWLGKHFTKEVRKDVATLKDETGKKFDEIKKDRAEKVEELKTDYNNKITSLKSDLDSFEERTNTIISEVKSGTEKNHMVLTDRMNKMDKSNDLQTIRQIKAHILDFANSCINKRQHTKKDFENIIHENQEYEALLAKYPEVKNDAYTDDYNYVMKIYHKCKEEGTFLKGDT